MKNLINQIENSATNCRRYLYPNPYFYFPRQMRLSFRNLATIRIAFLDCTLK